MKKLITLLLAVAGMVSTASATTIYFVDNWGKDGFKIHYWGGDNGTDWNSPEDFPSALAEKIDGFSVYELNVGNNTSFLVKFNDNGVHQTVDVTSIADGDYYEFNEWNDGNPTVKKFTTIYTYNYNVTTATEWSNLYFHCWDNSGSNVSTPDWPGQNLGKTFTCKSFSSDLKVIFHKNDGNQTGDLWAAPGTNNYYIASITATKNDTYNTYGQGVKTNAEGYATTVSYSPLSIPSGIAYYATDDNDGTATAHSLTSPGADVPMLVKGNANTIYAFAAASSGSDDTSENAFNKGKDANLGASEDGGYNYILKGGEFYLANDNYVASNKAYLKLSVAAKGRVLKFFGDEETGINAVSSSMVNSDACYNLSGQRIANPAKGLYIRGGKKVIVK